MKSQLSGARFCNLRKGWFVLSYGGFPSMSLVLLTWSVFLCLRACVRACVWVCAFMCNCCGSNY